jgi:hypothetical protein
MKRKLFRILTCTLLTIAAVCFLYNKASFAEKPPYILDKNYDGYWPISPTYYKNDNINRLSLKEPLYKKSRKIWPDLPYTDTDVKLKALKGFLWTLKFMHVEEHLKNNENNYLTMLSTMFSSAKEPFFRRIAQEEAKIVITKLIADGFIRRYENDIDTLTEYLSLINRLGLVNHELRELTFRKLAQEKENLIKNITKLKNTKVDDDELYDAMLLTYYITNIKKNYPGVAALNDLPDLRDFMEILNKHKYYLEDAKNIDYSKLSNDDISKISDDLYNITHVIFVMCDYNSYKVPKRYFTREIAYMTKYYGLICSKYNYDPDLLAEVSHVFTLMGFPRDYYIVKNGYRIILDSQRYDGSWKAYDLDDEEPDEEKNYDIFHATWVPVDMMVEQHFLGTAPFYKPLQVSLENYGRKHKSIWEENKLESVSTSRTDAYHR